MTRAEQQKLSEIKRHIEYNQTLKIRIAELEGTLDEINYECDLAGVHKGNVATRVRELNGLYKQSKEKENYGRRT